MKVHADFYNLVFDFTFDDNWNILVAGLPGLGRIFAIFLSA